MKYCPYCEKEICSKKVILALLMDSDLHINELARKLKVMPSSIVTQIGKLEIEGLIKRKVGGQGKKTVITLIQK